MTLVILGADGSGKSTVAERVIENLRITFPPGKSLHRLGTELDLGPPSAYGWLARNARRYGFLKRYPWEPWHFGLRLPYINVYDGGNVASGTKPTMFRSSLTVQP